MKTLVELERERLDITHRHIWNNAMSRGARPAPPDTSALDRQITTARETAGRLFWQRTQRQVAAAENMPAARHRQYVEEAIRLGKKVPPQVLADYPDLAPKA